MTAEKQHVLVVDDDEPVRDMYRLTLVEAGFDVVCAASGSEALALADDHVPHVAVVDLLMDDMPGLAVMQELRKRDGYVECVIVTGQAPEESAAAASQLGAFSYLMKPSHPALFVLTVRRAAQRSALMRAIDVERATVAEMLNAVDQPLALFDANGVLLEAGKGLPKESLDDPSLTVQLAEAVKSVQPSVLTLPVGGDTRTFRLLPIPGRNGHVARVLLSAAGADSA